jgi:hypothetical protein
VVPLAVPLTTSKPPLLTMVPIAVPKTSLTSRFRFVARLAGDPVISSLPTAVAAMAGKAMRVLRALWQGEKKKRAAGVVSFRRLVLALRGLTGLLNPYVKPGTKLFQPYFVNCFNCASPALPV